MRATFNYAPNVLAFTTTHFKGNPLLIAIFCPWARDYQPQNMIKPDGFFGARDFSEQQVSDFLAIYDLCGQDATKLMVASNAAMHLHVGFGFIKQYPFTGPKQPINAAHVQAVLDQYGPEIDAQVAEIRRRNAAGNPRPSFYQHTNHPRNHRRPR